MKILLVLVLLYLFIGLIIGPVLIVKKIPMVDEQMKDTGKLFKLLILPGCIVLWPLIIYKIRSK